MRKKCLFWSRDHVAETNIKVANVVSAVKRKLVSDFLTKEEYLNAFTVWTSEQHQSNGE